MGEEEAVKPFGVISGDSEELRKHSSLCYVSAKKTYQGGMQRRGKVLDKK